ncbi:hypothetical protein [Microbacterium oleivorans]|uniref:3-polyprenyl-4-hydroxybenzoate decarboxylase n=1 Tax=Microbacterium oleivorans TaxID=273677 RepID=A0A031FRI5_9MICO|nr:hypothetical protein [Microbacterium oleivorans]EZP26806.1 3-polyprenyl-4-hydroxybenzoate decarboxylase [Microbacterium oleivorans]THE08237.1 hypothetical protein E1I21_03600 [Microbacterium oleivorans]
MYVDSETLRALPTRRPADASTRASRIQWDLITDDRYEVRIGGEVAGFIDVVGAVYVVLAGPRYDRAVEVIQTIVWSTATTALDQHRSRG